MDFRIDEVLQHIANCNIELSKRLSIRSFEWYAIQELKDAVVKLTTIVSQLIEQKEKKDGS